MFLCAAYKWLKNVSSLPSTTNSLAEHMSASSWCATLNAGSLKPPGKQYDLLLHKNGDITDNCRNLSEKPRNLGTVVAGDNAAVTLNNIENRWQVDGNVDSLAGRALVLRHRDTDLPATCAVIGDAHRQ